MDKLKEFIKENRYIELSELLSDAINYSSTGTELLMKARHYLELFIKENDTISAEDCTSIEVIIAEINALLK